jgi:hypothetical protein
MGRMEYTFFYKSILQDKYIDVLKIIHDLYS